VVPDLGYVTVTAEGFVEAFAVREAIFRQAWKRKYAEDILADIRSELERNYDGRLVLKYRRCLGKLKVTNE